MTIIALTTQLRASQKGDGHGGVFLLDIEGGRGAQVLNWTRPDIDWSGFGGARGLRGIGVQGEQVFIAADGELEVFTPGFELLGSHRCPYLRDAQGLTVFENRVYVVSAAFDALLAFDLDLQRFSWGLHIANDEAGLRAAPFDPMGTLGPTVRNRLQLQSVFADNRGLFVSGPGTLGLLHFDGQRIARLMSLPEGARDARPWRDGLLFNDTPSDAARFVTPEQNKVFAVLPYPESAYAAEKVPDPAVARAGYASGLCVLDDHRFASGSSPLTVTLHDVESMKTMQRFNLDMDIRHSAHSMMLWPYPG